MQTHPQQTSVSFLPSGLRIAHSMTSTIVVGTVGLHCFRPRKRIPPRKNHGAARFTALIQKDGKGRRFTAPEDATLWTSKWSMPRTQWSWSKLPVRNFVGFPFLNFLLQWLRWIAFCKGSIKKRSRSCLRSITEFQGVFTTSKSSQVQASFEDSDDQSLILYHPPQINAIQNGGKLLAWLDVT